MPAGTQSPGTPGAIQCTVNPRNPWIILGVTQSTCYNHFGAGNPTGRLNYDVDATSGTGCATTQSCP